MFTKKANSSWGSYLHLESLVEWLIHTLNNANEFPPQAHIFTKDKDPWLDLKDNVICFEKMYDPKITWPKESLERYKMFLENKSKDIN